MRKKGPWTLSRETITRVVNFIRDGGSYYAAEMKTGIRHSTIIYHCKKHGVITHRSFSSSRGEKKISNSPNMPKLEQVREIRPLRQYKAPNKRFQDDNSFYIACIMKSKMDPEEKKRIIEQYKKGREHYSQEYFVDSGLTPSLNF